MHQDYRASLDPNNRQYLNETSLIPFMAIQQNRNKFKKDEIPVERLAISAGVTAVLYYLRIFVR